MEIQEEGFQHILSVWCSSHVHLLVGKASQVQLCGWLTPLRRDEKVSTSFLNDTRNTNVNRIVRHQES